MEVIQLEKKYNTVWTAPKSNSKVKSIPLAHKEEI
jgi:hypothetical protein